MSRRCRKCVICKKQEYKSGDEKVFFTRFPPDERRCREWLRLAGVEELVHIPVEKLCKTRYVCAAHFEPKAFNRKKTRLRKWSVPTLNLKNPPLTDEQLVEFPQHIWNYKPPEPKADTSQPSEINFIEICQENISESTPANETSKGDESNPNKRKFNGSGIESKLLNINLQDIQSKLSKAKMRKPNESLVTMEKTGELKKQLTHTLTSLRKSVDLIEMFLKEL